MVVNKLFREEPYRTECTATITKKQDNSIWLDQTIFFAFAGGQETDSGTINGIEVLGAEVEADTDIRYDLTDASTLKVGDQVEVQIDADKRDKLRRLHSAVHVLWFVFLEAHGKHTEIGSNISPTKGRLDFDYPESVSPLIPDLEKKLNELIAQGHPVERELVEGDRWMWKMGEWVMPCGGTHVKDIKEIGPIKLKRKNIGSGKERFEVMLVEN